MTAVAADYDNDGWPDIYVACDSTPSWLFRNHHDGTFREEGLQRGAALSEDGLEQAGMGVAWVTTISTAIWTSSKRTSPTTRMSSTATTAKETSTTSRFGSAWAWRPGTSDGERGWSIWTTMGFRICSW